MTQYDVHYNRLVRLAGFVINDVPGRPGDYCLFNSIAYQLNSDNDDQIDALMLRGKIVEYL